ncbi:hypothetical protein [Lentzea aerocolonigenes]|uniref:hypothetical protein n=1 Tax=Lentzea aerocolonigenes TaxID=68170 RepID=UPI000A425990|nr:hypothetical protein [Lentzea aerocolonigenes]
MRKPHRDVVDDFDRACEVRRRNSVKAMLQELREEILEAYAAYDAAEGVPPSVAPIGFDKPQAEALRGNYPHTYEGGVLAELRSKAFAAIEDDLCPMCGVGYVRALDHYLPKEKYPEFSVLALNLVPTCTRCNENKLSLVGGAGGRFFHAYYEEVPETPSILLADIEVAYGSAIVSFKVNDELPEVIYKNAAYHFERLRLSETYVGPAVQELVERVPFFESWYEGGGSEKVARKAHRQAEHLRNEFGPQFWKAALYDAVEKNHDFCDGGFSLLASRNC